MKKLLLSVFGICLMFVAVNAQSNDVKINLGVQPTQTQDEKPIDIRSAVKNTKNSTFKIAPAQSNAATVNNNAVANQAKINELQEKLNWYLANNPASPRVQYLQNAIAELQ